ncbi:hypothetical protein DRJ19_05265 [Candidatus Woesearchaeota archaeon]|nr:MAG: hypothetical protein DRJ19_05265 [Candidatus Woesearchaeota archaeon]
MFTGREYNWQTKLYHYRARTYHPVLGRFLSRDLLRAETDYNYANNDPVLFVDPKGLLLCVRSEKSKGKGWKVASTDILVKWFVNLLRECGADVGLGYVYLIPWEATCCPGNPDYVMVLAYPTGEGYFHKRIKEIAASKKEIYYEIRSRHPGGKMVSRFGQWQARQQLVFRSDFEAVRSALNRVKPNPALHGGFSVCELLLHEIVEQYLSAARYHAYGPSHKEALEVQSEYRRREGLKYWRTESPVRGLSIWRRIVPRQFHAGANLFSYTGESGRLIVVVSFRDSAAAVWSTELRNQR